MSAISQPRRAFNTTRTGSGFTSQTVQQVWEKGSTVPGRDPAVYRKDVCGALIRRDRYGQTGAQGWEVDHKVPVSKGGGDELSNLQPLHWENNRAKSDGLLACVVRA